MTDLSQECSLQKFFLKRYSKAPSQNIWHVRDTKTLIGLSIDHLQMVSYIQMVSCVCLRTVSDRGCVPDHLHRADWKCRWVEGPGKMLDDDIHNPASSLPTGTFLRCVLRSLSRIQPQVPKAVISSLTHYLLAFLLFLSPPYCPHCAPGIRWTDKPPVLNSWSQSLVLEYPCQDT